MNVPWMPLVVDAQDAAEPTGNSLDPTADRREQSGRGFTGAGAGRTAAAAAAGGHGNRTSAPRVPAAAVAAAVAADADGDDSDDDRFPYDEVTVSRAQESGVNGTEAVAAAGDIREPVLRPKSRIRMYRMPDGSESPVDGAALTNRQQPPPPPPPVNGSSSVERSSFIVHLLPQKLMNIIEQAERYARMAFSPFMWTTKERAQRALKSFPRFLLFNRSSESVVNVQRQDDGPNSRYIPLTYRADDDDRQPAEAIGTRMTVPAMTDDSPDVQEDLLSKEDIR